MKRGPITIALAASLALHLAGAVLIGKWFPGELGIAAKPATLPELSVVVLREAETGNAPAVKLPAPPLRKPFPGVSPPLLIPAEPASGILTSAKVPQMDSGASPPHSNGAPSPSEAPATAPGPSAEAGKESAPSLAQAALVQASYLYTPLPPYPPAARRLDQHGVVLVRVYVNREGRPDEVRLARSSGVGVLDEAALGAVSGWKFAPARRGAEPVASWIEVPVRFRLE